MKARRSPPGTGSLALGLLIALAVLVIAVGPARAQQSEADVLVAQAILAYEDKRYEEALSLLREALAQNPNSLDALYYTGLTLLAQQKPGEAVGPLERARARAPGDLAVLFQLGVAYFSLQDYERAEGPLTEVFRAEPKTDGVGYYLGFIRYRKRDYGGALEAFRGGASADPDIQQLTRFYSGLALAALGKREEAASEVQAALRLQPGSALTGPAERLRDSVLAPRRPDQRLQIELRAGLSYDTNVLVLPQPSHDPIAEALRRKRDEQASLGEVFGARFDYTFLRTGPWQANIGYQLFQTIYNDLPDLDTQNHVATVGGSYSSAVGTLPYQLGAQYTYDYLSIDAEAFLQRHTVGLFGTLVEGPAHLSAVQFRFQSKDFFNDADINVNERRDGLNYMLGLLHVFRFAGDRHLIRVGYQYDLEDTRGRDFEYNGNRLLVGGQYTLPWWGTRLKYDYDVHFRNYRHVNSIFPVTSPTKRERHDTEQTHVVRIEQPLPAGFTLTFEFQGIVARSTLPVFSYNRSVMSLILSWQY